MPAWKEVKVPDWKKIWKPVWVPVKKEAWKEVQVSFKSLIMLRNNNKNEISISRCQHGKKFGNPNGLKFKSQLKKI